MKLLIAVCLFVVAAAQHHTDPGHTGGTGNHHPNPECHQNSDCTNTCANNTVNVCINHKCECTTVVKRAAACHDKDCDASCPAGQNGICNSQGHCECGDHVGKRAHCNPHDCVCPDGQNGICNTQGHCECGDHVGKRAHCNPHDCVCPDGQNGICNTQGHCECGDHVGK